MSEAKDYNKNTEKEEKNYTGNKGEWSEIYVFLKLLADGKIYIADKDMNRLGDEVFQEIISIDREEEPGREYLYCRDGDDVSIKLNGEEKKRIPAREFGVQAQRVWDMITHEKGTTFTDERVAAFLDSIYVFKIKSPSKPKGKKFGGIIDIVLETKDYRSGVDQTMGFSIKSDVGAAPSLFNVSGDNTNFKFKLIGDVNDDVMNKFNGMCKQKKKSDGSTEEDVATKERINCLKENGIDLEFVGPVKDTAKANIIMCGGKEMPLIVGEMLKFFYYDNDGESTSIKDAIDYLAKIETNPALYIVEPKKNESVEGALYNMYYHKTANLLYDMFVGMGLTNLWDGRSGVNGGYVNVKNDGDVVVFLSCFADEFKDFLVKNTIFVAPSLTRTQSMSIDKENGEYYIKLALQIRFKKTRKKRNRLN